MECKEMKIGEVKTIGKINPIKYECVENENGTCEGCAFEKERSCFDYGVHYHLGECCKSERTDNKTIMFKEVM